jgi:16S rRNA (guanine(966)-N(2))-methyltransferase RsmD
LYAGSGAVALEALSRGAREVWAAENAVPAVKALRENVAAMGAALMGQALKIETRGVRELLEKERGFDVVFLDPPYEAAKEYTATLETLGRVKGIVAEGGLVVAEHSKKNDLQERYGRLLRTRVLTQGDAALSFYEVEDDDS